MVEIYSEKASGTNIQDRAEFNRMMQDCRSGLIDLILTKSVSRFGRNTVGTLTAAMELFHLGVKVEFEKEQINNYSREMRTAMALQAVFAQEESQAMSDNIKWGIQQSMMEQIRKIKNKVYNLEQMLKNQDERLAEVRQYLSKTEPGKTEQPRSTAARPSGSAGYSGTSYRARG